MARTTLNLEPGVLSELKRRAKRQKRPLGDVASDELARAFKQPGQGVHWPPEGWITKSMGQPAIPLEDGEALWEFLDREMMGSES